MAAFVAAATLRQKIASVIRFFDVLLPPPLLETMKFADKELRSCLGFVEKLDSSSRKRMNASLGQIAEALRDFDDLFMSRLEKVYYKLCERFEGDEIQFSIDVQDLKQDTHSFIETLKKMMEEVEYCSSSRVDSGGNKSKMVGLADEYSELKASITSDEGESYFTIIGMTGIGKTTIAKKIFEDLDILEWFDYHVWLDVGKGIKLEEIPKAILAQVDPEAHKRLTGGFEEIAKYLKEKLTNKRYLIVLDDVESTDVFHYVTICLPDKESEKGRTERRRLLVTTRSLLVVLQFETDRYPLEVRLLNKEESWQLLSDKVFGEDLCPPELEEAGKKIAEKCDGLPLTIITVANLLSKVSESLWIEIAAQKKHQLFVEAYDEISKVLYPIYEKLDQRKRLCLLYLGMFPQKYEIPKSMLINLLVVEEIFELEDSDTLENFLVLSMELLFYNSYVTGYELSSKTSTQLNPFLGIKSCGLHSSWWHLSHKEARKNNFFRVLDSYKDASEELIRTHSRLSIHNNILFGIKDVYNSIEENCASTVRTLLCIGPYHQYPVPICFGLKLLKRLHALQVRFYEFPLEVLELVELKYLALTCHGDLPPSICKLLKLQFLIVDRHLRIKSNGSLSYLPLEIWDMGKLNQLQVMGCDLPDLGDTSLPKLSTLSDVSARSCTEGVLGRIPNLKKLGIRIELMPDATEPLCCFDHIYHLNELESLTCVIVNPEFKFGVLLTPLSIFPLNLKKLCLSGLGYSWEEMRKVASLPNLLVLKLRCNAFQGPKWEIEENEFPKLEELLIEDVDLVQFRAGRGSFKGLQRLRIKHCYKLRELHLSYCENFPKIFVDESNPLVEKEIKAALLQRKYATYFEIHSSWNS